jgi:hypothetical protein
LGCAFDSSRGKIEALFDLGADTRNIAERQGEQRLGHILWPPDGYAVRLIELAGDFREQAVAANPIEQCSGRRRYGGCDP